MLEELLSQIKSEFPDFRLEMKGDSRLMRVVGTLLAVVTFGKMRTFMQRYTTTLGDTVYVSESWDRMDDVSKCVLLRHERVHMRQSRKHGRILFSLLYVVPFFPLFAARWRVKFEQEAYEESMRAIVQLRGTSQLFTKEYKAFMLDQFLGPAYGWMGLAFRRSVEKWYMDTLEKVVDEYMSRGKN